MSRKRNRSKLPPKQKLTTKLANGAKTGIKSVAKFAFQPDQGNRKVHMALWVIIPFFVLALAALVILQPDFSTWFNSVSNFLEWVFGLFAGGNSIENIAGRFGGGGLFGSGQGGNNGYGYNGYNGNYQPQPSPDFSQQPYTPPPISGGMNTYPPSQINNGQPIIQNQQNSQGPPVAPPPPQGQGPLPFP